jgi:hypothetical protein
MSKKIEGQITKIVEKISKLGLMIPGSISKQFNVCGTPNCKCKDPKNPIKHGPYYNLSYTFQKKSRTKFIPAEKVSMTKEAVNNYKKFKTLCEKLIEKNIELFDLKKQINKNEK